ncbi:conserved Plasmodium protein, unknown function [Plasmodium gallinaceum]|uniref:Uncharacterized protein n=1 Tax=Plasmodium gallinaceum TaxID=5849 RepID=A0A1J1GS07_PLAGA|nr:conserved Plasmodium protein, unknown function [Plasmodium gallinaceum]CRG94088.1 conserved Plasmodium protein, unknown function [Plasmodium gallinaceum]
MENSIRHSIDIKSEDFVVIIALQNLQTFIMIGYTAVNKVHLSFDFSYLWALCVGTLLFIYSLISFVIIRTFVFSKIDIGKYILELLFIASIIVTCSLSIIIDSFKIANMQLLFFSFALTGYAYYNLITLIFFSVSIGILIEYNLNVEGFASNIDALFFIDLLSYILQIIGGNILYFRMYELCHLIVLSKKNPCKYVVASKEVKHLEKQIFTSLLNSYMCFKSKTYSDLAYTNDLLNKDNSILDNDMKTNSIISQTKPNSNKIFHFDSDNNNNNNNDINNNNNNNSNNNNINNNNNDINNNNNSNDNNNNNINNNNNNTNSYLKKLKISNTLSFINNSNYNTKTLSLVKKISNKKLHSNNNNNKEVTKKNSAYLDNLKNQDKLEQISKELRNSEVDKLPHIKNKYEYLEKKKKLKKIDKFPKKEKSGLIINSKKSLFMTEDTHKEEIFNNDNYENSKTDEINNENHESIITVRSSTMDDNIRKDNILLGKKMKSDFIINILNNKDDNEKHYMKNNIEKRKDKISINSERTLKHCYKRNCNQNDFNDLNYNKKIIINDSNCDKHAINDNSYKFNKNNTYEHNIYEDDDYHFHYSMNYFSKRSSKKKKNKELNKNETKKSSERNTSNLNEILYDENKENNDLFKSEGKSKMKYLKKKFFYSKNNNFLNFLFRNNKEKIHNNNLIKKKKNSNMEEIYEDIYEYNESKCDNNLKRSNYNINFESTIRKNESILEKKENKEKKGIQNENMKRKKSKVETENNYYKKNSIEQSENDKNCIYKYDQKYFIDKNNNNNNNKYNIEKNYINNETKYGKCKSVELTVNRNTIDESKDTLRLENKLMSKNIFLSEGSEMNENNNDIILKCEKKTLYKNVLFRKSKSSLYISNDSENNSNNCTLSNNRSRIFVSNYLHKISNKEARSGSNSNSNYKYDKKSASNQQHEILDKIIELDISSQTKKSKKKNKKKELSLSKKKIYFTSKKRKRYKLFFLDNPKLKILFMSLPRCFKNIYDLSKRVFVDLKKKKILMQNATWKNKSFIPERDPLGLFKNTKLENWYITWMNEFNKNIISKTYYIYIYLIIYIIALDLLTSYKLYCTNIANSALLHQNYLSYFLLKTLVNAFIYISFFSLFKNKNKNDYDIRKYYILTLFLCIIKLIICSVDIYVAISSLDYFRSPYFVYIYIHMLIIQTSVLLIVRYPTQYLLFFIYLICFSSIYWTFSIQKSFMEFIFIIACIIFTIIYSYILCSRTLEINRRILFSKYELPYLLYLKEIVYCLNKNQNKGYL